jgi:hypothetical protein
LREAHAEAYRAYVRTLREGLADVDVEAVDVGRPSASIPVLYTHQTLATYYTYHTWFTYHTFHTTGTIGTIQTSGTVATESSIE